MANCPRCKKVVYANQQICTCGEKLVIEVKAILDRCGWRDGCPDIGTMRSGHDGPWYCRQHWRLLNGIKGDAPKSINLESILQKRMAELDLNEKPEKAREFLFTKFGGYANLIKNQNEKEAKEEREAIQQESKMTFKDLENKAQW